MANKGSTARDVEKLFLIIPTMVEIPEVKTRIFELEGSGIRHRYFEDLKIKKIIKKTTVFQNLN